jgi:hypothetical protein
MRNSKIATKNHRRVVFLVSEQYGYTVGVALSLLTQQVHDFFWSMISQIADKPTKM